MVSKFALANAEKPLIAAELYGYVLRGGLVHDDVRLLRTSTELRYTSVTLKRISSLLDVTNPLSIT
jgi:hypothetical protein